MTLNELLEKRPHLADREIPSFGSSNERMYSESIGALEEGTLLNDSVSYILKDDKVVSVTHLQRLDNAFTVIDEVLPVLGHPSDFKSVGGRAVLIWEDSERSIVLTMPKRIDTDYDSTSANRLEKTQLDYQRAVTIQEMNRAMYDLYIQTIKEDSEETYEVSLIKDYVFGFEVREIKDQAEVDTKSNSPLAFVSKANGSDTEKDSVPIFEGDKSGTFPAVLWGFLAIIGAGVVWMRYRR